MIARPSSVSMDGFRAACALLALAFLVPEPARGVTVALKGGDQVTGELVSKSASETVIEHAVFGRLVIPANEIRPADGDQPGLFGSSILEGWHKELGLGISGEEGNSPEKDFRAHLVLRRETDDWRWRWEGDYKLVTEGGDRTNQSGRLTNRYDWLLPASDWFAFVGTGYQYDEFESWEHRVQAGAGPGYHLVESEAFDLDVLFGPSLTYEFGDQYQTRVEVLFGIEGRWAPLDGHELRFRNYFYPQVNESEIRNLTRVEWKMSLPGADHLGLTLGADNEYDTAGDDDEFNLKYWTSLSYDF